jgi:coenzyme PQQ biosynthesis protein PqqD
VQTDKPTGKPVLLYPEGALFLNSTGESVVKLCTGQATFGQIVIELAGRFRVSEEKVAPEVAEFLNRLRARNLLEVLPESSPASPSAGPAAA